MKLVVGQSLWSLVDATTVVVVRCPDTDLALTCGDREMTAKSGSRPAVSSDAVGDGLLMGKRYTADDQGLELLCVRPGAHPVAVNGTRLVQKNAKPLPASD